MVRRKEQCRGIGFADEIDTAIAAIELNPEEWPSYDHGTRHYLLRRYPFGVVYRIEAARILVVAVAHGHRRPGYWASRLRPCVVTDGLRVSR